MHYVGKPKIRYLKMSTFCACQQKERQKDCFCIINYYIWVQYRKKTLAGFTSVKALGVAYYYALPQGILVLK